MNGNDRIRARLERLYGFYTNRTDRLFDIGVTPGGHDDNPELRLMAYRWINRHLKGENPPVTEPELPPIEGRLLRAFPEQLPADELNTKIDELFVAEATNSPPQTADAFQSWRRDKLAELRRIVFRNVTEKFAPQAELKLDRRKVESGSCFTEPGVMVPWRHFPAEGATSGQTLWLVVLDEDETLESKPGWLTNALGGDAAFLIAPRGTGPLRWPNPAPYYIRRSLPLLGRTVDSCRLVDVLASATRVLQMKEFPFQQVKIVGRGSAGIIAAYAALLEPRLAEVVVFDPPSSHREGPIFLNVLRVLDVPEALGLLAPRPLTIFTAQARAFDSTASIYRTAGGTLKLPPSR